MRSAAAATLRIAVFVAATFVGVLPSPSFGQKEWPAKPIRFILGAGAGSAPDARARMFAQKIAESIGQSVIVENRPGGSGAIAAEAVARAAPDGYTFLYAGPNELTFYPLLAESPRYDPLRDFTPIALPTSAGYLLVLANANLGITSVSGLVERAGSSPARLSCGATGQTSVASFACSEFARAARIDLVTVNYKSPAQVVLAVATGEVPLGFSVLFDAAPHLRSGKIRALAVLGPNRLDVLPDVPSVVEAGLPGPQMFLWTIFAGPAGTPPAVVKRMNEEFAKAAKLPDVREAVIGSGSALVPYSPEETTAFLRAQNEKWRKIIKDAGVRPQ